MQEISYAQARARGQRIHIRNHLRALLSIVVDMAGVKGRTIASRPTRVDHDPERGYQIRYNQHPNKKNNFRAAEMFDCYKDGMSCATIAKLYKCTRQSVHEIFRTRGYPLRSKKLRGARVVDGVRYTFDGYGYLRGTKDGRRIYLHRFLWEQTNGPVPPGFQLHFKDNNKERCSIDNLELVPLQEMGRIFNPTHRNQFSV